MNVKFWWCSKYSIRYTKIVAYKVSVEATKQAGDL